jgi:hypothetical protein
MRIAYRRTFALFLDNYLATYFGTPGQTFLRLLGGPLLIVLAVLLGIYTRSSNAWNWVKLLLNLAALGIMLYGLGYMLRPAINLLLVWLRREQVLGTGEAALSLTLAGDRLQVDDGRDPFDVPFEQILAVQRRARSAWIITKTDNLLYFPFDGLLEGDAEAFLDVLESALAPEEESG